MRISAALLAIGLIAGSSAIASAQPPAGGQAPPPMKNLQIIPADTPRQQVIQTMQSFAQGLGAGVAAAQPGVLPAAGSQLSVDEHGLRREEGHARRDQECRKGARDRSANAQAKQQLERLKK